MGLNPLIIFMHMLNDSFSSPFKRFKPYQDHIFVFVLFIVGFSRYRPRNGVKLHFSIAFSIERSRNFACFWAFRYLIFENQSIFGHNINRLSYSCGLLIAFFQILWAIIGWKTFLVSFFSGHWNFTGRLTSDVIMAKIIGRAIASLRKQSWPLPPAHIIGARESRDLRSPSPIMAPDES